VNEDVNINKTKDYDRTTVGRTTHDPKENDNLVTSPEMVRDFKGDLSPFNTRRKNAW
jgi:hypothetical protein